MPPLRFVASLSNDLKSSANVFCISRPLDSRFQRKGHKKTHKVVAYGSGIIGFLVLSNRSRSYLLHIFGNQYTNIKIN